MTDAGAELDQLEVLRGKLGAESLEDRRPAVLLREGAQIFGGPQRLQPSSDPEDLQGLAVQREHELPRLSSGRLALQLEQRPEEVEPPTPLLGRCRRPDGLLQPDGLDRFPAAPGAGLRAPPAPRLVLRRAAWFLAFPWQPARSSGDLIAGPKERSDPAPLVAGLPHTRGPRGMVRYRSPRLDEQSRAISSPSQV